MFCVENPLGIFSVGSLTFLDIKTILKSSFWISLYNNLIKIYLNHCYIVIQYILSLFISTAWIFTKHISGWPKYSDKVSINSARNRRKELAKWREKESKGSKHSIYLVSYKICKDFLFKSAILSKC